MTWSSVHNAFVPSPDSLDLKVDDRGERKSGTRRKHDGVSRTHEPEVCEGKQRHSENQRVLFSLLLGSDSLELKAGILNVGVKLEL